MTGQARDEEEDRTGKITGDHDFTLVKKLRTIVASSDILKSRISKYLVRSGYT